ncbi:SH3BGRL3 isoform 2 [Pongo abelii]|uniref:SH3 domain-binding glutamic acid-rich-like protein 3 n=1 Tax=Pongo abelii TaxID=9601 RepID=A0A2J8SIH7_PONAB|nr:SH3BGRL3 isoform 2 [Pongo abelii]
MSGLRVYSTSVTGSREIKSQQSEVTRILDGKRIQYQLVDISQDNALRDEMRALAGNPKATPPQIVNGDQYCGVWAGGLGVGERWKRTLARVRSATKHLGPLHSGDHPSPPLLQDYELFVEAVEQNKLQEFLKLA